MSSLKEKFNAWCMSNLGIITFVGVVATILVPIFVAGLDAHSVRNGMTNIINALTYRFPIYVYQLILLAAAGTFYSFRLRKKYRVQGISQKILIGIWKNNWGPPSAGHEILKITPDLKYYLGDEHIFDIKDFKYDPQKNIIEFRKVGVRVGDNRTVLNTLRIVDNDTLEGTEQDYPIRYTRIAG